MSHSSIPTPLHIDVQPKERTESPGILAATATSYGDALVVRRVFDPHLVKLSYLTDWGKGFDQICFAAVDIPKVINLLRDALAVIDAEDERAAKSLTEGGLH